MSATRKDVLAWVRYYRDRYEPIGMAALLPALALPEPEPKPETRPADEAAK